MTKELDVRIENLSYTARFSRPAFDLWQDGGTIMKNLYDALAPFGVTLQSIQATPTLPNMSTPLVTIGIGNSGSLKFAYDRLEFTFNDFTLDVFQSLPRLFSSTTHWLRDAVSNFQFASHEFNYFNHSYIKEWTTEDLLASVNPRMLESGGLPVGHGLIFHHTIPERKWLTHLIVDKSSHLPNALFLGLGIIVTQDGIDYDSFLVEGRSYLASMLRELDLAFPELSQ